MRPIFLLLALLLVGCGGVQTVAPVDTTAPANSRDDSALQARIDAAALDPVVRPMTVTTAGWDQTLPKPRRDGAGKYLESYYGNANAGQGGESIPSATAPSGVLNLLAYHTLYHGAEWSGGTQINLKKPVASQIGDVLLYAPTMKAPNGDCLEAGTAYYNGGVYTNYTTHAYIYAFDFCGGPGQTLHPDLVHGWFDKYVRINGGGVPEYAVQICNCTGAQAWSVRYYNYQTNVFDTFYSTTGFYTGFGEGGWTQFETQYNVKSGTSAACSPSLPAIEDTSVHFIVDGRAVWLTPKNAVPYQHLPGETSFGAWGTCFNYNKTKASYVFGFPYRVYDSWKVTSTGS
jgi:hypothetical protein